MKDGGTFLYKSNNQKLQHKTKETLNYISKNKVKIRNWGMEY